jgi:hypothetical protein
MAVMIKAVQTSETSVNSYQSTRRYNPEDILLHQDCNERRDKAVAYEIITHKLQRADPKAKREYATKNDNTRNL